MHTRNIILWYRTIHSDHLFGTRWNWGSCYCLETCLLNCAKLFSPHSMIHTDSFHQFQLFQFVNITLTLPVCQYRISVVTNSYTLFLRFRIEIREAKCGNENYCHVETFFERQKAKDLEIGMWHNNRIRNSLRITRWSIKTTQRRLSTQQPLLRKVSDGSFWGWFGWINAPLIELFLAVLTTVVPIHRFHCRLWRRRICQ